MKISQVKEVLNLIFEEDESLKYALATNLAKYGRPQSKKSDKPAKLTKGLEKGREKYVKDLKKSMSELDDSGLSKGYLEARKLIDNLRATTFRKLNDDELEEFRKTIADAFDMQLKESLSEDKADATRWFSNLKYFYQKAFRELKGEDRETYKQLAKDFFSKLEIDDKVRPVGLDEDEGTLNKIADMLDRKFPDLRFNVNTMADRIDVRGSQQDLMNFGSELHGEKIFDYEVFHTDDDDRGEIVRIVKSDSIMREDKKKADRCLRIARRKIPQSSAYRSGLIVKCRKGMIWKKEK